MSGTRSFETPGRQACLVIFGFLVVLLLVLAVGLEATALRWVSDILSQVP